MAASSVSSSSDTAHFHLRRFLSNLVPPLSSSLYKGQSGRICIVGGSSFYTGAPFFASLTSLRLGADLATVLTSVEAATAIKSYSPELMVRPTLLPQHLLQSNAPLSPHTSSSLSRPQVVESIVNEMAGVLSKSSAVVIGPGLGLDSFTSETCLSYLDHVRQSNLPLVIDGDAITIIAQSKPASIFGYEKCVLTPNPAEFRRLWKAYLPNKEEPAMACSVEDEEVRKIFEQIEKDKEMNQQKEEENQKPNLKNQNEETREILLSECGFLSSPATSSLLRPTHELAIAMGHVTILRKGVIDVISNGRGWGVYVANRGCEKRCGGQGDVLSGATGTALSWWTAKEKHEEKEKENSSTSSSDFGAEFAQFGPVFASCFSALLTRRCGERAFAAHGRSTLASHLVDEMEHVIEEWCSVRPKPKSSSRSKM